MKKHLRSVALLAVMVGSSACLGGAVGGGGGGGAVGGGAGGGGGNGGEMEMTQSPPGDRPSPAAITVNGRPADPSQVARIEQTLGVRVAPGAYWYDARSGLAGHWGSGAGTYAPGFDFGAVPRDASGGSTGVVFNGRELSLTEATFVAGLFNISPALIPQFAGDYDLLSTGDLFDAQGQWLGNLAALAQQRGRRSSGGGGGGGDNFWSSGGASGNSQGGCSYVHIPSSTGSGYTDASSGCG